MSADNGIYILKTPNFKTGHTEFRVSHCQAIENIDYPGEEVKYIKMYFGKSKIYKSQIEALTEAQRIYDKLEEDGFIIEYGIQTIELNREFPIQEKGFYLVEAET
jgi:hypothetical protein